MNKPNEPTGNMFNISESYISITLGFLVVLVAGVLLYNLITGKNQQSQTKESQKDESAKVEEQTGTDMLPTEHTVAANDSLWSVSEKYYGSGYNWVSIAEANKLSDPNQIDVGMKLQIPKAEVIKPGDKITGQKPETTITEAAVSTPKTYTIVRGDNLWKIAVKVYGDGYAWTKIAEANKLTENPNLIHADNTLTIP